jgi:hypothetical protein
MVAWSSPAGLNLYTFGENDLLAVWRLNSSTGRFNTPAVMVGDVVPKSGNAGGMMTLSANGSTAGTGVLWMSIPLSGDANQDDRPGVLRALQRRETSPAAVEQHDPADRRHREFSKGSIPCGGQRQGVPWLALPQDSTCTASHAQPDRTEGGTASGTGPPAPPASQ